MGTYNYTDSQTGKTYTFEYGGDAPTNEDWGAMSQIINADRDRLNQMAMEIMGEPLAPEDDRMAFRRGLDIGATSAYGALGTAARSAGEGIGIDFLRRFGAGMEQSAREEQLREATQMPAPTRLADVEGVGDFLTFVGEGAGQMLPEMGATIGGGFLGSLAGTAQGGPLGAGAGFIAGSTAVGTPLFFGRNIQRQEQQVEAGALPEVDRTKAFLNAVPQAALNALADKILATGRLLGLSVPASQNLFVRTGQFGAAGAITEVPTEIAQTLMERAQAGLPLDSEDAIAEYVEVAVLSGVIGTGVGGVRGAISRPEAPATQPPPVVPPVAGPAPATPPAPGPTREITDEDMADIGEGPTDLDPTAPITAETLATLGVPKTATIYQQVAAERLSGPQLDAALERYVAAASTLPEQQAAARNVQTFLQRRAAAIPGQGELPLGQPPQPQRVEPSPVGAGSVSGAPAVEQPPISGDLGTPGGIEPPAPVGVAVPDRGVGTAPAPEAPQPAALKPISWARKRFDAANQRTIDETGTAPIIDMSGRKIVVRDVNGVQVPFYLSSGRAGKADVPAGKWYPILGIDPDTGWLNKGSSAEIVNYYGSNALRQAAQELDATIGDIRNDTSVPRVGPTGPHMDIINQGLSPTANQQPDTMEKFNANLQQLLDRLGQTAPETAPAAPAQLFPDAQPSPRPISDTDAFELAEQEAKAERAAAPTTGDVPFDAPPSDPSLVGVDPFAGLNIPETPAPTPSVPPSSLTAQAAPPEAPPSPSADQIPALRSQVRAAERQAKSEFTSLKRPVALGMGLKLDPEGAAGQELLARGVTRKDAPGLFAKKAGTGLKDIDNIPANEHPQLMREGMVNVGPDGNFDRTDLLDALENEARGMPRQSAAMQEASRLRQELEALEQAVAATEYAPPLQPNEDPIGPLEGIRRLYSEKADAWNRPLSNDVVALLQNNDLQGALQLMANKTKNATIKSLIRKMSNFLGGVKVSVVDPDTMQLLSEVYGDGDLLYGSFIRSFTDAELDNFATAQGLSPEALDTLAGFQNTIVLDSALGLTPMVVLHEAVHAVTSRTVQNPNHPLTRLMEQILVAAREAIPGRVYELSSVSELVAYGMTNPAFMKELALVSSPLDGRRVSLLERFKNGALNLLRSFMGRKRIPINSVKDDVDLFFETALAPAPVYRGVGEIYSAAYTADGSRNIMDAMKANVKIPTAAEVRQTAQRITDSTVASPRAKSFLLDLAVPLPYLAEYAKQYIPSAPRVDTLVNEHAGYKSRLIDITNNTLTEVASYFRKHGQGVVDSINKIRLEAAENEYQVNPFDPESKYNQFELTQVDYNPDGTEAKRTVRQFQTRQARNAEGARLNRNARAGQRRAIEFTDPDAARIAKHKELVALTNALPEGGKDVLRRLFALPEVYRKEMQLVIEERLKDMLPTQRAMQERIYREVFDKLFADNLLYVYQTFSRDGEFSLSYEARDPDSKDIKIFKHNFTSLAARTDAIMRLEAFQEAEKNVPQADRQVDVRNITPYQKTDEFGAGGPPPTAFLMSLLNKVTEGNYLGDPDVEKRIVQLIFETAPETSFLQSYRKRKGVPGYLGDITPLDARLTTGDTVEIIARNGYRMATQAADIRYQTKFAKLRTAMRDEYTQYEKNLQVTEPDGRMRSKKQADAYMYLGKLNDATRAPFQPVALWSQTLTALGYTMALGGNVSTATLSYFHLPLMIAPMLMGKYGGSVAMQAIGRATRILAASGREAERGRFRTIERVSPDGGVERVRVRIGGYDLSIGNRDYDNDPRSAYLKPLFEAANAAGTLTRSMSQEQVDASTALGKMEKLAAWSGLMQHHSEQHVRQVTMISDYLANAYNKIPGMKNQMSFKQFVKALEDGRVVIPADIAADVAADAVKTGDYANGSIYAASAPKLAQSNIGRILYLFKRFPISMTNLLVHTARRSVGDNPEDRRIARLQLATMSGSMALFAGAAGMPLFHTVAALYDNMWPRDEDDEDFETLLRTGFLGELGTKGLANYLFGINLSERIGLGGVFYRPPLNSADLPWYGVLVEGYGGPVLALGSKAERAAYFASQGEYYRSVEAALPTAMGNMLKSFRFGTEGALTMRKDPILEVFSPYEVGAQFLGFMPARYEQQLSINRAQQAISNAVNAEIQSLLRRLYIARREGDRDTFQEVMQEIRDFNARMPPSARINRPSIRRSLDSHQRRTQEMVSGVTLSPRMRPELMQLATEYGPVSWMDQR